MSHDPCFVYVWPMYGLCLGCVWPMFGLRLTGWRGGGLGALCDMLKHGANCTHVNCPYATCLTIVTPHPYHPACPGFRRAQDSACSAASSKSCPEPAHRCFIESAGVALALGGRAEGSLSSLGAAEPAPWLLNLKWGEGEGEEDSNKDRVYISTNARQSVDTCNGLGSFVSFGGERIAGDTGGSVNVGVLHDVSPRVQP